MMHPVKHFLMAILFFTGMLSATHSFAQNAESDLPKEPSYTAVLINNLIEQKITGIFDCKERVYLLVTWYNVFGPHRFTALWFNPQGKQQDAADLDFIGEEGVVEGWLALEFLNVDGGGNPLSASTSGAEFSGTWQVKLLLDGKEVETQNFQVKCQ